jgi:AraC-like DNA-binding protein
MIIDSMVQTNLQLLSNSSLGSTRVAATERVSIEMVRCLPDTTVRWRAPAAKLGLIWVRDRRAAMRVLSNERLVHDSSAGDVNFWFFPEGFDVVGELVARSATNCVGVFVEPSFVPVHMKTELAQPIVGFSCGTLARAFGTFAGQLAEPYELQPMYIDGWAIQMLAHVPSVSRMGRSRCPARASGLAPWQLRRAKEMLLADISDNLPLSAVAAACRLSMSHFARAFRVSTGIPPHRWLITERIKSARGLLAQSETPLARIATMCGFADQSHFSRVFAQVNGTTPRMWRREQSFESCTPQSGSLAAGPPPSKLTTPETINRVTR